ncbi:hypothetical protein PGB90_001006 [Kerria lacca]
MILTNALGFFFSISICIIHNSLQNNNYNNPNIVNNSVVIIADSTFVAANNLQISDVIQTYKNSLQGNNTEYTNVLTVEFSTSMNIKVTKELTTILAIGTCADIWNMYNNAEDKDIMYLIITENKCKRLPINEAITIPLINEGFELPQLIIDLLFTKAITWTTAVILYDESINEYLINDAIATLSGKLSAQGSIGLMIFRITTADTDWERRKIIYHLFAKFSQTDKNQNFLVVAKFDTVSFIIEMAKRFGLTTPQDQWLIIIPDTNIISNSIEMFIGLISEGENFSFIINKSKIEKTCVYGLLCYIKELLQVLLSGLERNFFEELKLSEHVSEEEWETIKPSKSDRRESIITYMKARLSEIGVCGNCTSWLAQSALTWGIEFQQNAADSIELIQSGIWQIQTGFKLNEPIFPHIENGFRGVTIPIITFHVRYPPWQILKINESGHIEKYSGLVFEIVNRLSQSLNFTCNVIIVSNNTEGFSNNSRMSKDMETVHGEDGAAAFYIDTKRNGLINFTTPVAIEPYCILTAKAQPVSRALLFTAPFTVEIWLCIAFSVLMITPILNYFHRLSPYYEYYNIKHSGGLSHTINCFWYIYGALLQQGGTYLPEADSGRLVIGTWWLFVLVIVTTYSGSLVAFLTFPQMKTMVTNINELLNAADDGITWGIPNRSNLQKLLKDLQDEPKFKMLYDKAEFNTEVSESLMQRIRNGKHIYIHHKTNLLFLMKREFQRTNSCDYTLGNDEFLEERLAMATTFQSPYLKLINREIERMQRVGLIRKWMSEYLPKRDKCWKNKQTDAANHTVNMNDMQGSFFDLSLDSSQLTSNYCGRNTKRKRNRM